jgi:hypothetical protein
MKYFNRSFKDQNTNSSKEQNPSKVWLYPSHLVAKNSSCYDVYFLRSFKEKKLTLQRNPNLVSYGHIKAIWQQKIRRRRRN